MIRPLLLWILLCIPAGCAGSMDRAFYWPDHRDHLPASMARALAAGQAERVVLRSPGGPDLDGIWLPQPDGGLGTVVYCHGNSRNWTFFLERVHWYWRAGYQLLAFDYRGFGASEGVPSREGTIQDTVAALDFALQRDPERTFLVGHSLGGAIGIEAAARRRGVRAVVAIATFSDYRVVAETVVPALAPLVPWLVSGGLGPEHAFHRLAPRPLLILHGKRDRLIPFGLGLRTRDRAIAAGVPTWFLATDTGHRSGWREHGAAYENDITDFFEAVLSGRITPGPQLPM